MDQSPRSHAKVEPASTDECTALHINGVCRTDVEVRADTLCEVVTPHSAKTENFTPYVACEPQQRFKIRCVGERVTLSDRTRSRLTQCLVSKSPLVRVLHA